MTYYTHPGYSAVDHQLDPLIEAAHGWIAGDFATHMTPEQRRDEADRIAGAIEAAAAYIRAMGQKAEPTDVYCDKCGAEPGQPCWDLRENPPYDPEHPENYGRRKHPHDSRRTDARGIYRHELI